MGWHQQLDVEMSISASGENPPTTFFPTAALNSCYSYFMLDNSTFRVTLPVAQPGVISRNFLVSVDGRASNVNLLLDSVHHDIHLSMGSYVYLRVIDRGDSSPDVYETDFVPFASEPVVTGAGFKVQLLT